MSNSETTVATALTPADLDRLEGLARDVDSGRMGPALYGTLLPGVFAALVALARKGLASGAPSVEPFNTRTLYARLSERVAAVLPDEAAPIVGSAVPSPPVIGKVKTVYSQLVPFDAKTPDLVVELNGVRFVREPRWIPVEERLPEPERPVLVAIKNGPRLPSYVEWEPYIVRTGERWAPAGGPLEWWTEGQGYVLSSVTHWQPLPAPPETKP